MDVGTGRIAADLQMRGQKKTQGPDHGPVGIKGIVSSTSGFRSSYGLGSGLKAAYELEGFQRPQGENNDEWIRGRKEGAVRREVAGQEGSWLK